MIYTVTGAIEPDQLGITLMHEHVMVDYIGADGMNKNRYSLSEVVETMLPYLKELKQAGCQTFVDATPPGNGRDVEVLRECALRSGLQIMTCTGTFRDKGVSSAIRAMSIDEIVMYWEREFREGIEGTEIRPGFIKIALDDGPISPLQRKILRAAARTSLHTGLPIQSHTLLPETVQEAATVLDEEGLPLHNFIWTHSDCNRNVSAMIEMGRRGMWLQIDSIGFFAHDDHVQMLKTLIKAGLLHRLLLSQDRGWYVVGKDKGKYVNPYHPILTEFIPLCQMRGLSDEEIEQMLVKNPAQVLNIL